MHLIPDINRDQLRKIAALVCCLVSTLSIRTAAAQSAGAGQAGQGRTFEDWQGFAVRYGLAGSPTEEYLQKLVDRPSVIAIVTRQFMDSATGQRVLEASADGEAVYDVPIEAFAQVLEPDYKHPLGPGVLESEVRERSGSHAIVYQLIGSSFLGIRVTYSTLNEIFRDVLPGGAIGFRARMTKSLDGKLYASNSSWYLQSVVLGGRSMTYVRMFMDSDIFNPFPGMESLMRAFMPGQVNAMLRDNYRKAQELK